MSSIESLKHTTLFAVGCRRDLEKSIQNTQGKDYGKSHTYYKFCYSRWHGEIMWPLCIK